MFSIVLSVVLALPQAPPVKTLQQAPPVKECGCSFGEPCLCGDNCRCKSTWQGVRDQCAKKGCPVVVFVGVPSRRIERACSAQESSFPDVRGPAIIVGVPDGKGWFTRVDLPATADDAEIMRAAMPRAAASVRVLSYQPAYQPAPMMMQPMMFGGFGGGGGGRGGGGC